MNPNIVPPAEAIPQPMPEQTWALVLVALLFFGVLALVTLIVRTEARIRRVRSEFRERRWQVKQQYSRALFAMAETRNNPPRTAVTTQRQDMSPITVPVSNDDIRDRRKITRLY